VETVRLDKWLWAMRLYKTRARATAACRKSAVLLNGESAKASAKVRIGDRVDARLRELTRSYLVNELTDKRVGAAKLPEFITDQTTGEELEKARLRRENARTHQYQGGGRPTKKNRRDLEKFFGREG